MLVSNQFIVKQEQDMYDKNFDKILFIFITYGFKGKFNFGNKM